MKSNGMVAAAVAAFFGSAALSSGALLSIDATAQYSAAMSPSANLTPTGNLDWAYWQQEGAGLGTTLAPTNEKATGGNIISSLALVGGVTATTPNPSFRGTANATTVGRYSWTGGTGTATGNNVSLDSGLVFNDSTAVNNAGFSLTIQGDPSVARYVVLYVGGFSATGNLALSLTGATPLTTSVTYGGISPKHITAYQILFQPDNVGDVLNIQFTATGTGANGHVGMEAITVGLNRVIPEPSVALLGGLGALFLIRRRR